MSDIRYRVQNILRDVLDDPALVIDDSTGVGHPEEWDSVATVHIVLAAEQEFGVRLSTDAVGSLKTANELIAQVEQLTGSAA